MNDGSQNRELLRVTLQAAVPMWIEKIRSERWSWERIRERATTHGETIAFEGDKLMFRPTRKKDQGGSARVFNALAEGLACLAHCPGGVTFLGEHWEATVTWT